MNKERIAVIGAGGHAKVVASTLMAAGHQVVGFYDDNLQKRGTNIFGIPVIGPVSELTSGNFSHAIIGIGQNETRKRLVEKLHLNWITVIHPYAWVHPEVLLGAGTVVCAGAIVQPYSRIGSHVIINTKTSVDHDCCVGDYVHLAFSHLAGGVTAHEGAFLALGSTVFPGVQIGAWATVSAGSVAMKDVMPKSTVAGVPARLIKEATFN
ncbi:MAG: acetyltransferase [Nostocales cyanobacterium LacPavin_0920_SED1_MAG_38_18]|uniref:acetyltransferase n=1 Tax=Aphanizomenonaceae TaxID=1892259 RepID=UPI0004868327|nr:MULTISPECIES: acetyltransferase [Aphanizomenonaceae]MBE9256929.1 acetyltransferase [Dolichospermum sp. LEGE 00246]MCX5980342.1 acetyltransferase [Nostocales cyanobacterium LacPavin_0920_SED1_MAG_38_18]MDK2408195.1 acetyltransferase [Aphanizomenon sp. 202]MDK2457980.1 acetyltransferase [Aphanizomenon sp. PH219]